MDTETVSPNFDDIRPLNNSEVKDAIEKLVANERTAAWRSARHTA